MTDKPEGRTSHVMLESARRFKRFIAGVLMVLMFAVVGIVTLELAAGLIGAVIPGGSDALQRVAFSEAKLMEVLGLFLAVLIALELIETVEVYFRDRAIHVEIVILVAIIALARKFILLDPKAYGSLTLLALGAIMFALGATYFMVRKAPPIEE